METVNKSNMSLIYIVWLSEASVDNFSTNVIWRWEKRNAYEC